MRIGTSSPASHAGRTGPRKPLRESAAAALDLSDRVALITGAGNGIGRATALKFAELGARIIVADIEADAASRTATEICDLGGTAVSATADVGSTKDIGDLVEGTIEKFGRLDILHNNAAWYTRKEAVEMPEEEWDKTITVSLKAAFVSAKFAIPRMLDTGGAIVNTASVHGLVAFPKHPAYAAAKAGLIGLTHQLAREYGSANIRVNAVVPGAIDTRIWGEGKAAEERKRERARDVPLGRLGYAEEVADAVVFLASDMASYITGECLVVDGGLVACR